MYILAGEHNLMITKQDVHRDNGIGLILRIEVARNSITIGDLEAIINDIADNAYQITVYDDNDEKIAILSGFHCEPSIIAKGGVYKVELIDESENTFQLGRQKLMIEQLETLTVNHGTALNNHAQALATHDTAIVSHTQALENHETQVAGLTESSAIQSATMESILLEVIPAVISQAIAEATAQAVAKAVEQALEAVASSNTEEEYLEYDEDEQYSELVEEETTEETETDVPEESTKELAGETIEETTGDNPEVIEE